jgi:hypothetical protein
MKGIPLEIGQEMLNTMMKNNEDLIWAPIICKEKN